MITSTIEKTRFYTGEVITYAQAETAWLHDQALYGDDRESRSYAAAGIMRAVLNVGQESRHEEYIDAVNWASELLLSIRADTPVHSESLPAFVRELPPVEGKFDSVSTTATKANRPDVMAKLLTRVIGKDSPIFVIGVGHGGVIAAADTCIALGNQAKGFYPVRFSRHKMQDRDPVVSYAGENVHLLDQIEGTSVVVIDDDRSYVTHASTIWAATTTFAIYFGDLVGSPVFGVTPVTGRHPNSFHPEIISGKGTTLLNAWAWGSELQDGGTGQVIEL